MPINSTSIFNQNRLVDVLSLLLFFSSIALILWWSIRDIGSFSYPIDDTYIHLGLAKSLSEHFVFGLSQVSSSCSSSPLFGLIIAVFYKIFPSPEYIPLVLNLFFSSILILFVNQKLSFFQNQFYKLFFSVFIIFSGSILLQTIMGMEHVLHGFLFLHYLFFSAKIFRNYQSECYLWCLILLSNILILVRFESIFVVTILNILVLFHGKFKVFLKLILSYTSLVIFGLFSISQGAHFFPNSVLIKAKLPHTDLIGIVRLVFKFFTTFSPVATDFPHAISVLFIPLIIVFVIRQIRKSSGFTAPGNLILILWLGSASSQLLFASIGWLFRYEFFLVVSGFVLLLRESKPVFKYISSANWNLSKVIAVALLGQILIPVLFIRGHVEGNKLALEGMKAIANQQKVMGRFVHKYYDKSHVGLNDVGAVSFISEAKIFDLAGLCNNEVAHIVTTKGKKVLADTVFFMASKKDVSLIMIYDHWFSDAPKADYFKVGTMKVPEEEITAGDSVSFYVKDNLAALILVKNMNDFKPELPDGVTFHVSGKR